MAGANDLDPTALVCHRCGSMLTPGTGSFYVVHISAVADPTPPSIQGDEGDPSSAIEALLEAMSDLSEQELLDQVHRRLTITLCGPCFRVWIERPVG